MIMLYYVALKELFPLPVCFILGVSITMSLLFSFNLLSSSSIFYLADTPPPAADSPHTALLASISLSYRLDS